MITAEDKILLQLTRGYCHSMLCGAEGELLKRYYPQLELEITADTVTLRRKAPPEAPTLPHITPQGLQQAQPVTIAVPADDELAGAKAAAAAALAPQTGSLLPVT